MPLKVCMFPAHDDMDPTIFKWSENQQPRYKRPTFFMFLYTKPTFRTWSENMLKFGQFFISFY